MKKSGALFSLIPLCLLLLRHEERGGEKTSLELVFVADHSSDEREKRGGRGSYIEECALGQQFSTYLSSLPVDDWRLLELVSGPTIVQLIGSDGCFGARHHPKNELLCDNR